MTRQGFETVSAAILALFPPFTQAEERLALILYRPDGVERMDAPPLLSLVAPEPAKATADIVSHFCCDVQFFASENAAREWQVKRAGAYLATLDQAWQLGRRHNAQRYPTLCP